MSTPRTRPAQPRFAPDLFELDERAVPAVVAVNDNYRATTGQVFNVSINNGVLKNDFSSTDSGAVLTATLVGQPAFFGFDANGDNNADILANPVPANAVVLNPNGSFTVAVPSNLPANTQGIIFSYIAANATNPNEVPAASTVVIYLGRASADRFAVAPQAGAAPIVNVYDAGTGQLVQSVEAYEDSFRGGVHVAEADLNADGVPDLITAPAEGGGPRIKVFDGRTGRLLLDQFVFDPGFKGGAYVAAGDVNADGFTDLIVGAGSGGGPRVLAINGQAFLAEAPNFDAFFNSGFDTETGSTILIDPLMDFFAYEPTFRDGVRVAAGDVAGVGRDFVITAPGPGGGPVVKTFDYNNVVGPPSVVLNNDPINGGATVTRQPLSQPGVNFGGSAEATQSFLAGDPNSRNGVNIAAGDVDGNGVAEIITGAATGPAVVSVFNGQTGGLINQFGVPYQQTPTGSGGTGADGLLGGTLPPSGLLLGTARPNALVPTGTTGVSVDGSQVPQPNGNLDVASFATGGVTVASIDYNGDGKADIITGAGPGNSPRVRITRQNGDPLTDFLAFPANVLTGVYVG